MATVDEKEAVGRGRSPNYPYLDLPTAIEKTRRLYQSIGRLAVGIDVAVKSTGYSATSGSGKKVLGALRSFGLLDDSKAGQNLRVKLSDRALDIVADYREGSPDWCRIVEEAASAPRIHSVLLAEYGGELPPDDELRRYLVRVYDPPFTDAGASDFIAEIRSTLQYVNKHKRNLDTLENGSDPETPQREVQVGSLVQWTSKGVDQFPEPRKFVGIEGEWAFVEGSPTGVPMSELTVVDSMAPDLAAPPVNPFHRASGAAQSRSASSAFPTISSTTGGIQSYPLYGAPGTGNLSIPAAMRRKDFELYKRQIENSLAIIEATAVNDDEDED